MQIRYYIFVGLLKTEYKKLSIRVAGRKAQLVTCKVPDEKNGLVYYAKAYFADTLMPEAGGMDRGGLTITVACRKRADLEIAKRIISSIEFDQQFSRS